MISLYSRITLLVVLFSLCKYSFASEKVSITSEPLWLYKTNTDLSRKPVAKSISSGYYLELSDHQVNLVNNTEYTHYIRHIVNESGVQNASEVSVTFSPEFQQVAFHKISLIREGRVVSEVKTAQIKVVQEETDASDFQYNGLKRAFVLLKDVRKDDRIEVAYSLVGFNPVFTNKFSDQIYFGNSTAVCNYFETVIVPQNRKLFLRYFNKASVATEQVQGNTHIYHWSNPSLKIWESQPGVPSWFDNNPKVSLTEFENWSDVINWGVQIFNNYQYTLPADLKSKIARWHIIAKNDKDMFTSLAIRFVQDQVRYLGLEMGRYTHQPHSPALVYQQRFGDCKDKALLLATILQNNDVPAYVALVNTEKTEKLPETAPATDQFDHAIVAIERSSGYIFVDPTETRQRGELANLYIPSYGYSLVLRTGETKLRRIEPDLFFETSIIESLDVRFADTSRLSVLSTYSGGSADQIRSNYADASTSEIEDSYLHYYTKKFDGIIQSDAIDVKDDSLQNKITVKKSYAIPELWHTDEKGKESFSIYAQPIYERLPNPANVFKNAPIALDFPLTLQYKVAINMPDTWGFDFDPIHIKNDSYQFDFVPVASGSHISARYYLKTFKDNIPLSDLSKYKSDYNKIDKVLDFELYNTSQEAADKVSVHSDVNWPMILFTFLLIAAFAALLKYLDRHSLDIPSRDAEGQKLGGWLIVLGLTLLVGGVVQIFSFVNSNYFYKSLWISLGATGGVKLQLVLLTELAFSLLWICGDIAVLYWLVNRRDIFPHMFMWYVGTLVLGQLILFVLSSLIPHSTALGDLKPAYGLGVIRSIIYGLVWITYLNRSQRVKETFIK